MGTNTRAGVRASRRIARCVSHLKAKPDTSQAEITEAVEIINSMHTEPRDKDLGFRLVFTITTNDWDSG